MRRFGRPRAGRARKRPLRAAAGSGLRPAPMPSNLPVDAGRLWGNIMALAAITDPEKPYTRWSLGAFFSNGREWLARRFADAGLEARIDAAGNLIGRRGAGSGVSSRSSWVL